MVLKRRGYLELMLQTYGRYSVFGLIRMVSMRISFIGEVDDDRPMMDKKNQYREPFFVAH